MTDQYLSRQETKLYDIVTAHTHEIRLFLILFVVNVFIYGQKLFFYSFPADDYMRFYGDPHTKMLITNSARWAQALLNEYVFAGKLQILPYLHGLIGIFCFTLMGYLSAKYLLRERTSEVAVVTLMISVSPMFAHNLYFSTNITTWLALLLGVVGFLLAHRKGFAAKAAGLLLMVFAIGNYQSIIQIVLLLALFRVLISVWEAEGGASVRLAVVQMAGWVVFLLTAYVISFGINEWFLHHYNLHETHRLAKAEHAPLTFAMVSERLHRIYTEWLPFNFFGRAFNLLYLLVFLATAVGAVVGCIRNRSPFLLKIVKLILFMAALVVIPVIVKLPELMGVDIPIRAYFPVGWALSGLLVLQFVFFRGWLRNITWVSALLIMVLNLYYITLFFDSCKRQTDADIRRANMIVQRIRMDDEYRGEPIAFHISGQKAFNVDGWRMKWQQPFNSFWSKYKFFRYFTDMRFRDMTPVELQEITKYIVDRGETIRSYPGKNSIIVYHNKAVLFLNADKINILIQKRQNLKKIPLERKADLHAVFDLYVQDNILFYYKKECTLDDIRKKFFLRIYPKDPLHTVINGKVGGAFQTWDFHFPLYGRRDGHTCIAAVELPTRYEIAKIRTGQFGNKKLDWDVSYQFGKEKGQLANIEERRKNR